MTELPPGIPVPVSWSEDGEALRLLDQTLLPGEERHLRLERVEEVAEAIRSLRVRGAPAIGIAAALGLAMGLARRLDAVVERGDRLEPGDLRAGFLEDLELLRRTRPTAVNLGWALERLEAVFRRSEHAAPEALLRAVRDQADAIARDDREMCRRIGELGVEVIPGEGCGVLTHCNAGALATGGIGTALAPLYIAHARGLPIRVYADETRPLLQGARLTAWELQRAGVDCTVVTDSMAGSLLASGRVGLVVVGADRVAANGDVANKIGTYGLALLAQHHGIPFYVALPRSTFDAAAPSGREIPIEERDPAEVLAPGGRRVAPEGVAAWNPAFDVTPAHLVTAFLTDGGILRPPYPEAIRRLLAEGSGLPSSPPAPESQP